MKLYKLNLLILSIFIYSCNSEIQEPINNTSFPIINSTPNKVRGDGKSDLLGFAFDATKEFLDPNGHSYAVLDIKKLTNNSFVFHDDPTNSELDITTGSNAITLLDNYVAKFTADGGFSKSTETNDPKLPFTGSLSDDYTSSNKITSKSTYANADLISIVSHWAIKPFINIEDLQNCLTDEFVRDIQNFTAEQIILKYGTHVYTDIYTGGRAHFTYRCFTTSSDKDETANYYAKVGVGNATQSNLALSATTKNVTTTSSTALNETFQYHTYGGAGSLSGSWTPGQPPVINFNNWASTVKLSEPSSLQTVKVADNSLVPIYNFVSDPTKKAALKTAVENHIANNSLTLIPVIPLYRFRHKDTSNHFYTIKAGEVANSNSWESEGIAAFVSGTQQANMVPFYRFYKKIKIFLGPTYLDHYYTCDKASGGKNGYGLEGDPMCYVYSTQMPGTVPLKQYYSSSRRDHFYCTLPSTENLSGYSYNNDCCYVYPGYR